MPIDYKKELNPAQLDAVMHERGPALVIAGAGSGKTRALVFRVARLVESGVPASSILLLTFTRRAANEMLTRAKTLLKRERFGVMGGTFHSVANLVLKSHAGLVGYPHGFVIIDRTDSEAVLKLLADELDLIKKRRSFPKKAALADIISRSVNTEKPIEEVLFRFYPLHEPFLGEIETLASAYAGYKVRQRFMDFDDLLTNMIRLLGENPEVRGQLGQRFKHILVDEYQDVNRLQANIVKLLGADHGNVMVVGDDSQSIYSFRGADFRNILEFPEIFPEARVIKLEENFRSTQPILDAANAIIHGAQRGYTKCLFTVREGGERPYLAVLPDEAAQSRFVADQVAGLISEGLKLPEIAVLFRAGFHSFDLEVELNRRGVPYVKHGGVRFVEAAHIKDLLAHLRLLVNPGDLISWHRALLLVERVGPKTVRRVLHALGESPSLEGFFGFVEKEGGKTPGLLNLAKLLGKLSTEKFTVSEMVGLVKRYYEPMLKAKFENHPKRLGELEYVEDWTAKYAGLREFLDEVALDPLETSGNNGSGEFLTISTVHSAKGLEWRAVFVISLLEGRFPSIRSMDDPDDLEEERRLLYVASTRAKEKLFFSYPVWVFDRGSGRAFAEPSRFLMELPPESVHLLEQRGHEQMFAEKVQARRDARFPPGTRVVHDILGTGVVVEVVTDDKVRVRFHDGSLRLLHLGYANLEPA